MLEPPRDFEQYCRALTDWKKGKKSGYPECCIKHYIYMTAFLHIEAPYKMMDAVYGQNDENYVQCPKCRIRKLINQVGEPDA